MRLQETSCFCPLKRRWFDPLAHGPRATLPRVPDCGTPEREWVVTLPFALIGQGPSYEVSLQGRLGEPCQLGGEEALIQDAVPDEGTATYTP